MTEPIERCQGCRFWQLLQAERGICRRNSPWPKDQEMADDGRSVVYRVSWPETHEADWCGDFQPALRPASQSQSSPPFPQDLPNASGVAVAGDEKLEVRSFPQPFPAV